MTLPNVVIGGAPKCGTSSLFAWLRDHPQVCASHDKETRYLMDADSPLRLAGRSVHEQGIEGYAALFAHCELSEDIRVVLEATPDYLYQETALRVLSQLSPRPIVLFVLRRPSSRIYSHYQYARNNMAILPKSLTFEAFVAAVRADDPRLGSLRNLRHVLAYSRYADYIEPWHRALGDTGLKVYLTEQMHADPAGFMRSIARDIGIGESFYEHYGFPRLNETYAVRSQFLQRMRVVVGGRMRSDRWKRWFRAIYDRSNLSPVAPRPSQEDRRVMALLDEEFADPNARLASLTGLDLGAWQ